MQICTFNINTVYFSGCVSKLNNSTIHLIEVFLTRKHTFWQTDVPDKRPPTECYMSNYSVQHTVGCIRRVWRYQKGEEEQLAKGESTKGQTTIYKTYT